MRVEFRQGSIMMGSVFARDLSVLLESLPKQQLTFYLNKSSPGFELSLPFL